jgi:glucosylceramidase
LLKGQSANENINIAVKPSQVIFISFSFLMGLRADAFSEQIPNHVEIYVTAKETGQRLAKTDEVEMDAARPVSEKEEYIFVDPAKTFQTIIGIGGALTDASAETFYKLPADKQQEILQAYFDPQNGIGYTLGRTHIHSCDFSSESYTYIKDGDKQLDSFDISHDLKYRIPFIKAAMAETGNHLT